MVGLSAPDLSLPITSVLLALLSSTVRLIISSSSSSVSTARPDFRLVKLLFFSLIGWSSSALFTIQFRSLITSSLNRTLTDGFSLLISSLSLLASEELEFFAPGLPWHRKQLSKSVSIFSLLSLFAFWIFSCNNWLFRLAKFESISMNSRSLKLSNWVKQIKLFYSMSLLLHALDMRASGDVVLRTCSQLVHLSSTCECQAWLALLDAFWPQWMHY